MVVFHISVGSYCDVNHPPCFNPDLIIPGYRFISPNLTFEVCGILLVFIYMFLLNVF